MTRSIRLERRVTHDAALRLWDEISAASGQDLELDCSEVRHLGATCLQVLMVTDRAWRSNGHTLNFVSPSDAFLEGLRTLGAEKLISGDMA